MDISHSLDFTEGYKFNNERATWASALFSAFFEGREAWCIATAKPYRLSLDQLGEAASTRQGEQYGA